MARPLYREYTRDTRESLKRLAHGTRLHRAAELMPISDTTRVLDYGCGDGGLLEQLLERASDGNLYGFDPYLLDQMDSAVKSRVTVFSDTVSLLHDHAESFDVVFCIEVCEHLSDVANDVLMTNIGSLLKPDGHVVFGVPIEIGVSGFAKNVYRTAKGRRQGANWALAIRALLARPIPRKFDEEDWTDSHLGFDHRTLERQIQRRGFSVVRREYLPWPALRAMLNNEVYFICSR